MKEKMSIGEVRHIVSELGLGIPAASTLFDTAVLLLAAEVVGQDVRRLSVFTGLSPRFVASRAARFHKQNIWRGAKGLNYGAWEQEGGDDAFLVAVLAGEGIVSIQS